MDRKIQAPFLWIPLSGFLRQGSFGEKNSNPGSNGPFPGLRPSKMLKKDIFDNSNLPFLSIALTLLNTKGYGYGTQFSCLARRALSNGI